MRLRGGPALAVACLVLAAGAGVARADVTKDQCVEANTNAQVLRMDGKLAAARAQLAICNNAACPRIVRDDCAQRLDEVQRAQPTIVFDVRDAAGNDVSDVRASIDGRDLDGVLAGRAITMDPGSHTITISAQGLRTKTETMVFTEGEKGRIEHVVLAPIGPSSPVVTQPVPSPTAAHAWWGARRIAGLSATGAGVGGLVLGGVFGALTFAATSRQKDDCASATSCSNHASALSDHSTATTDGLISTVSFIAGAVLAAGGAALFFTGGSRESQSASVVVSPAAFSGPAGLVGFVAAGRF